MPKPQRYPPINPKFPHLLHGGDYNPDQWPEEIWHEDMRLMELARCNAMSVGIFAWSRLEPEEGRFDFSWLDQIMDMLHARGIYAVLATPSGARPAWLSAKYPEVLRVRPDRTRNLHGLRHNHCFTSPIYREKVRIINTKLAERYRDHPALLVWHISNEYGGECHCELCREAFRQWLQRKYGSLDALNHAWWTAFWSHTYTDWSQIDPPSPIGESRLHGLNLDWKRFVTDQTIDFMLAEAAPLRAITPDVPITTNFMGTYPGLNYWKMAPHLDVISWDSYPQWHGAEPDWVLAANVAFTHDINRCLKGGKPFMLMESTPSTTNWFPVAKLKRPGMHLLSSLQAVAHGSDTVQYFQWRKSRGSSEKFHGAVVDHVGHEHTRVFRDVAQVGELLQRLDGVVGTTTQPEVALIYDWENNWAINDAQGPRIEKKDYLPTCQRHYRPFWQRGIPVDVIDMDQELEGYRLLIAPMLYMVRPGVAERIEAFVRNGGTFVATYWSGIVDENDLCFLGGFPGPLRDVLGIWAEEIDALYDHDVNHVVPVPGNSLGLSGLYTARELCDLIHAESAQVLATYRDDFYAGRPALTVNHFGQGQAYYIASRNDDRFLSDFYGALARHLGLARALETDLPPGVTAQVRGDGERRYIFLMNFNPTPVTVAVPGPYTDLLSGQTVDGPTGLASYGVMVLTA
ncbi:beta-galactosidase [Litorilinea aerophila]|uniref:Beta-galactosidase n=1 Tax=Litorilinea aerophila TaxID=1204385 RepID=A0A540VCC6_9CHLR|nr:beta-galactosidase [Litorilinea aerophila]MCC9078432.1 beta-galactosidase [Litorilinea aerophila]